MAGAAQRNAIKVRRAIAIMNAIGNQEIAARGDVIFIVEEENIKAKPRVSSSILTLASPVFAALLGPHFREGQGERSPEDPREISLPDDEALAMSDLCNLLHFKTPKGLRAGTFASRILSLAIAVDKYGCSEALRLQGQGLLLQWSNECDWSKRPTAPELGAMASAAYLFENESAFTSLTSRLTKEGNEGLTWMFNSHFGKIIPAHGLRKSAHAEPKR